tara:strand:+ start:60746 stop:61810 length:1065 start_codon:yes stop_codon:yes gene_type:complete
MKKIDSIISNLDNNSDITENDLNILKTIDEEELEYLLMLKENNPNKDYLIKAYFTVYNEQVANKLYLLNPTLLEDNFGKVWVESILNESIQNIIFAYIPAKIFTTQLISYVRNGIQKRYSNDVITDFENQLFEIIEILGCEEEFILSKIYLLNKSYNNEEFLTKMDKDKELNKDFNQILKVVKESYKIIQKYKNKEAYNFEEINDLDVYYLIQKIFTIKFLKTLEESNKTENNKENILVNEKQKNENGININSALKIESQSEKKEDNNFIKKETENKKRSKKVKLKEINIETLKKRGNFKIIFFSLLMALVAIIISIKMIKTEIEKDSKTINNTIIEKSDIPVEIERKDNENKN